VLDVDVADLIAERCIKESLKFWRIDDGISVSFRFDKTDNLEAAGECDIDLKYRRAQITINPLHISDFEKLWQVVAHEMAHIVIADFDLFYRCVKTDEGTEPVFDYARERTTTQLERVFLRERSYEPVEEAAT
jgi:hypothetical protein